MLPGSHEASLGFFEATDPRAPRGIGLAADPGDVSLHYGDIMHAAPPPTGAGPFRRCVLLSFARVDAHNHAARPATTTCCSRAKTASRAPREGRAARLTRLGESGKFDAFRIHGRLGRVRARVRGREPAHAAWSEWKDEQEVFAVVHGEDGKPREVKIWLVVLDDRAYIRTRNTSWKPDLERDPKAALRSRTRSTRSA